MCRQSKLIFHILLLTVAAAVASRQVDEASQIPATVADAISTTTQSIVNYDEEHTDDWGIDATQSAASGIEQSELQNRSRINGGQVVSQIVPYQVSLQSRRRGQWQHFCGGAVISANHVLTAAHCLDRMTANAISVVGGTLTWRNGGDRHSVVAMRMHPRFASSPLITNDIAVIKVTPPFNVQKRTIGAISLSGSGRVGDNIPVRLTGWGLVTPNGGSALPEQLQMLNYRTISNAECAAKGFRVTANEVCALGEKGRGACMGDSGGPLVTPHGTPQLVGIVSYGTSTCALGRPDVYTRVSSFLPYINKVITSEIP